MLQEHGAELRIGCMEVNLSYKFCTKNIIITRIEPVGEPYREVCLSP